MSQFSVIFCNSISIELDEESAEILITLWSSHRSFVLGNFPYSINGSVQDLWCNRGTPGRALVPDGPHSRQSGNGVIRISFAVMEGSPIDLGMLTLTTTLNVYGGFGCGEAPKVLRRRRYFSVNSQTEVAHHTKKVSVEKPKRGASTQ